jgi:hypothetical protein
MILLAAGKPYRTAGSLRIIYFYSPMNTFGKIYFPLTGQINKESTLWRDANPVRD